MRLGTINNAKQAALFLQSLVLTEPRPYAQRALITRQAVSGLLSRLGNPQQALNVIHITGSKGKGSTALLAEAILCAAGLRVGTFTSPHLRRWTERYRIDGAELDDGRFTSIMEKLRPHVVAMQAECLTESPSFFDTATAAALALFAQEKVDVAIIEVGLGGRFDATNIVTPKVTCITSIELEHTDKLGASLAQIAYHKAGIIKPGVPLVVGSLPAEAMAVVAREAAKRNAPLCILQRDFQIQRKPDKTIRFVLDSVVINSELNLLGEQVMHNAALAIACVQKLNVLPENQLQDAVSKSFATVQLPARCEVLHNSPWIVVDGAHTVASILALKSALLPIPVKKRHWVLSLAVHKNPKVIFDVLLSPGDQVTLTRADPERSQHPQDIAGAIAGDVQVRIIYDPETAVRDAYQGLQPDTLLCVTGSVYMAGLGREVLLQLLDV